MADLQKRKHNFVDLIAEYDAKLEKMEALLKKAAKLDIENHKMKHQIVSKSAQLEEFNNVLIPKRNKLFNDVIDGHKSWLTSVNCSLQYRSRHTALINTKISKINQEAVQIKIDIANQKNEADQLQATIKQQTQNSKQPQKEYEAEIAKIQALQLVAEKRAAELKDSEEVEQELIKATKLNFIQVHDELQLLKQKYTEDEGIKDELERLRENEKDIVHQKVMSQVEIDVLQKEYNVVAETKNADEAKFNSTLEKLQAEKDNLLAEQQSQYLDNDMVIANLQSQLKKISLENAVENDAVNNATLLERHHSQASVRTDTSNRMQSNRFFHSSQQQGVLPKVVRKVHSTPNPTSSSNSSRLDLSPNFDVAQTPQQQQGEIQQHFNNRTNSNERSAPRNSQERSNSNSQNK